MGDAIAGEPDDSIDRLPRPVLPKELGPTTLSLSSRREDDADMTQNDAGHPQVQRAAQRRVQLYEAMAKLELDVARPAASAQWLVEVKDSLSELRQALAAHTREVEAPDGILAQILQSEPRFAATVADMKQDHQDLADALADVYTSFDAGDFARTRRKVIVLLGRLTLHRQAGSDLIYDAYNLDIGAAG